MFIWGQKSSGAIPFGTFYALSASVVVHPAFTHCTSAPPLVFLFLVYSLNMFIWGHKSSGAVPFGTFYALSASVVVHPALTHCSSAPPLVFVPFLQPENVHLGPKIIGRRPNRHLLRTFCFGGGALSTHSLTLQAPLPLCFFPFPAA